MLTRLKNNAAIIVLVFVALYLCFANYVPGTILSGWDNLHPEFNFGLNFERVLTGTFRIEQGLGAVAGHSHMADLPLLILLYIFHFGFATDFLRYSYLFLMLIAGPLVMFFLLRFIGATGRLLATRQNQTLAAFLGSSFYLLNVGTLQQFNVPFEMFLTQYGFLPWITFLALKYLQSGSKKILLAFSIVVIFASPMAYASVLWYLTFAAITAFVFLYACLSGAKKRQIKRALILFGLSILLNLYWILPNIYFVLLHGQDVVHADTNRLFSPQAFLYNKEFGNLQDILLLKTFYFDWKIYTPSGHFDNLLGPWILYLKSPLVLVIQYLLAGISGLGFIYALLKKDKVAISLIIPLGISLFFLINNNFPTATIYNLLDQHLPLFKEALRFPDDKVLGIFLFVYSCYFFYGHAAITAFFKKILRSKWTVVSPLYAGIFLLLLLIYMKPAFEGNLINQSMKIKIPAAYFELFNYMNKQADEGRVANLPINSLWGWEYYNWHSSSEPSYQGSGFLSFGIKQPILDRDFDRWNPDNEEYFREMSYAVYTQNSMLLTNTLQKYDIHYILLDTSLIDPGNDTKTLFYPQTKNLLAKTQIVQKPIKFGNSLFLYKVSEPHASMYILKNPINNLNPATTTQNDAAYQEFGSYITNLTKPGVSFPFTNLGDNQNHVDSATLSVDRLGVHLNSANLLTVPSITDKEKIIQAELVAKKTANSIAISFYPELPGLVKPIETSLPVNISKNLAIAINNKDVFVLPSLIDNTPLAIGTASLFTSKPNSLSMYDLSQGTEVETNLSNYYLNSCNGKADNQTFGVALGSDPKNTSNSFTLFGKNTPICLTYLLSSPTQNISSQQLLSLRYSYKGSLNPNLCLVNFNTNICTDSLTHFLTRQNPLSDVYPIPNNTYPLGLKIFLDTTYSTTTIKAIFTNFHLYLSSPIETSSFNLPQIHATTTHQIIIPFSGDSTLSQDITSLPRTTGSCLNNEPLSSPGLIKNVVRTQTTRYIRYSALEGTLCDHFSYQNLSGQQGYLLLVTTRNIRGLPLTMCLTNEVTRRCDLYATLGTNPNFTTDMFIVPPMEQIGGGFDVNISNLGIKETPSVNDLQNIEFIPVPYSLLTNITSGQQPAKKSTSIPLNIDSYPLFTKIILPKNANGQVFNYQAAYEPGWVAIGNTILPHVRVNNWANGWMLNDSSTIYIFFWPQILEYVGLVLVAVVVCLLVSRIYTTD